MKYLLWQFSAYAAVALALGIVVGRWTMTSRVATAERDRQRAAFELSALTMKASALLEESGRERSSVVDINGRMAVELRAARDAQLRIEAKLRSAELTRAQAETELDQMLRALGERSEVRPSTPAPDSRHLEIARLGSELASVRAELERRTSDSALAIATAEARARAAESAHHELSRVHAASIRAGQAQLTLALLRAERAEAARTTLRTGGEVEQILDLRQFDSGAPSDEARPADATVGRRK